MSAPIVVAQWPVTKRALWLPCLIHTMPPSRPPDPFLGGWACGCQAWNDHIPSEEKKG